MTAKQSKIRAVADRRKSLFARMDAETANFFLNLWENAEVGEIKENIPETKVFAREKVFTNEACNKLTEHGQNVALNYIFSIPEVERTCKFARYDFEDLKKSLAKGFPTDEQREYFLSRRECWWSHLRERMHDLRISKETLKTFGLDWKEVRSFAFQTI